MTQERQVGLDTRLTVAIAVRCGEWLRAVPSSRRICRRAAAAALAAVEPGLEDAELSVMLTDDAAIAGLNQKYRGHDAPTDVLSFANAEFHTTAAGAAPREAVPVLLGDVVVAFETASRDAAEYGLSLADHLSHLVIHGVLHIFGYDHENQKDAHHMEHLEVKLLAGLGIKDPYSPNPGNPGNPGGLGFE